MSKKVVLITGGGRGIGKEMCMKLSSENTHVALTYTRNSYKAEEVKHYLDERNISSSIHMLDIKDFHMCKSIVEEIEKKQCSINILVNNVGITLSKQFVSCNDAENKDVLYTNLQGVINMTLASVPSLKNATSSNNMGRMINISSNTSLCGNAGQVAYSSSKGGINGFTRLCARVLSKYNIIVNVIAPGYIDTDMTHDIPKSIYEHVLRASAISRVGNVEDVSSIVKLLCDENCNYMTGQVLHVDGGKFC
ncbi:SDR family NAD(P)-dependent oxidoreductase [Photorhabdus sp. CRCIA-P01]|uniref:SDR family NAD(P)-dependent oxidoreductase n=1 Tax=Photorhabdus sp. CRCIA-P01 TaxID=2019570 RepID=UPI000E59F627|nr:SDR family NAD(P)-dependent oxidoreductase [Photorhabdus sp. CRCIA-P01]